jgi:NAD(P) transhydrogenase
MKLALERMGGEVLLSDAVESIERVPGRRRKALRIQLKSGRALAADKILFSAGRSGNTRGLGLDRAGVNVDANGRLVVDDHFATNVPHIYAAGDVIGFPALASTSMEQGRVAMCHAFGIQFKDRVSEVLPYGIYAIPEIGMVGETEEELRRKGVAYEVGRARFENNPRGQITGEMDGLIKLLFEVPGKKLLGAHIIGEGATELTHIPEFVLAAGDLGRRKVLYSDYAQMRSTTSSSDMPDSICKSAYLRISCSRIPERRLPTERAEGWLSIFYSFTSDFRRGVSVTPI